MFVAVLNCQAQRWEVKPAVVERGDTLGPVHIEITGETPMFHSILNIKWDKSGSVKKKKGIIWKHVSSLHTPGWLPYTLGMLDGLAHLKRIQKIDIDIWGSWEHHDALNQDNHNRVMLSLVLKKWIAATAWSKVLLLDLFHHQKSLSNIIINFSILESWHKEYRSRKTDCEPVLNG